MQTHFVINGKHYFAPEEKQIMLRLSIPNHATWNKPHRVAVSHAITLCTNKSDALKHEG